MNEFDTLEQVKKLFEDVNCIGAENNYFLARKDSTKNSGMAGGMEYPYTGLLINCTENGLGIFYLDQPGIPLTYKLSKMQVKKESYTFIKNEDIKSITIKKYAILNNKIKSVSIKLNNGKNHKLMVNINEDNYGYHNIGFAKFIEKYDK